MTIPTPTSEPLTGHSATTGLPDLASLTQFANQLFQALPGTGLATSLSPATSSRLVGFGGSLAPSVPMLGQANLMPQATSFPVTPPLPVSQSAVASHLAPPSVITPRVLPTQAQTLDLPGGAATAAPALGRRGGPSLGVQEAYAAAVPLTAPVPALTDAAIPSSVSASPTSLKPESPFYFLGEEHGVPQARGATRSASPYSETNSSEAPAPLLTPSVPTVAGLPIPANAPAPSTPYYFLGEGSGYPLIVNGAPEPADPSDLITAQPFGLPGKEQVPRQPEAAPVEKTASPRAEPSATSYYFVESRPTASSATHSEPRRGEVPATPPGRGIFDVEAVRRDFPILRERVNGRPLIWLDNAATTQKPQAVIDRIAYFYAHENSNIHRAAHELAARATDAYEAARNKVARFLGAGSADEIIFVRGATEAINLVASSWGRKHIGEGDEIILSHLEHHANIVPWQMLAAERGAKLRIIPVDEQGQVLLNEYGKLLNDRTKLVAVTQVSNALGTIVPVQQIVEMAHRAGAKTLIDGAQAVSHLRVNMQTLGTDFYVFSGHKVFGPTGIGVVYGRREVLEDTPPYQGGGNMIADVTFEKTVYQGVPARFEAGTGNIADAVGLGAALDYLERLGLENVARYEHDLLDYATKRLKTVPGLRLIGTATEKTSVASFVLDSVKTEEVGKALNQEGIAVRAGHHCAQPILRRYGVEATVRPSLAFYNTCEEVDALVAALRRLVEGSRRVQ